MKITVHPHHAYPVFRRFFQSSFLSVCFMSIRHVSYSSFASLKRVNFIHEESQAQNKTSFSKNYIPV